MVLLTHLPPQQLDLIAQVRRFLEFQVFRGDLHLLFQFGHETLFLVFGDLLVIVFRTAQLGLAVLFSNVAHGFDDRLRRDAMLLVVRLLNAAATVRLVDMHAEATSEKVAMGWHLDGRVSAVVGTHTHVQTADERILPQGTAYLTDLGMTGSYAGVIGMNKSDVIARFTSVTARRADHSSGQVRICGAVIDVDEATGQARGIERVNLAHEQ